MSKYDLRCVASRYGWKYDAQSDSGDSCYVGNVYNDTNTRLYDTSLGFILNTDPEWGSYPIIISKITLNTTYKSGTPYNNLGIYLAKEYSSFPGAYTPEPYRSIGVFNSTSVDITDPEALSLINNYLSNKTAFYIHITGNVDGGVFYGANTFYPPSLSIEWEYAASTGTLSTSEIKTMSSIDLKLNVKGSNYYHQIDCYVNDIKTNLGITTEVLTNIEKIYSFNITPTKDEIDIWFSLSNYTSSSSPGYFLITTYRQEDNSQVGEKNIIPFTLYLQASTCINVNYFSIKDINFINTSSIKDTFIINKTKIEVIATYTNNSSNLKISSRNLVVYTGQQSITYNALSATALYQGTTFYATFTIKDSRGLFYTLTKYLEPQNSYSYTNIALENVKFYRSDGTKSSILGNKIGCSFTISTLSLDNKNQIKEFYIKDQKGNTSTTIKPNSTDYNYETTDLFGDGITFDTAKSYVLTIYIKDKITEDSALNGYSNNGYFIETIIVPKAEYIIHIPKGGQGIAFGAAYTQKEAYIECGWPLRINKGLQQVSIDSSGNEVISGLAISCGGTGAIDRAGAQQSLQVLPTTGGRMTGSITLASGKSLITNRNNNLLKATDLAGTSGQSLIDLGNSTDILTIYGSSINLEAGLLKYNGEKILTHSKSSWSFAPNPEYFERYENADDEAAGIIYPEQGLVLEYNGPFYTLNGAITNIQQLNFSGYTDNYLIGEIDSNDAPSYTAIYVCQGKDQQIWNLRINPDGSIYMERNRIGAYYTNCPINSRLIFHVSWIAK